MALAPLEELLQRELQERQGSSLPLYLEEQVPHQVPLKGELDVGQHRRALDDGTQVLGLHWPDHYLLLHDELTERRRRPEPVIEIGPQGEQHDDRAVRLRHRREQQLEEVPSLLLRQGQYLFELVDEQNHLLPWCLDQATG